MNVGLETPEVGKTEQLAMCRFGDAMHGAVLVDVAVVWIVRHAGRAHVMIARRGLVELLAATVEESERAQLVGDRFQAQSRVPLALGTGVGSELRRPLGIAIVGGLIVSQMLTLFTTPVTYLYLDRLRSRARKRAARIRADDGGAYPKLDM